MTYKIEETWLKAKEEEEVEEMVDAYLKIYREYLNGLSVFHRKQECISGTNRIQRKPFWSASDMDEEMIVKPGDVCYFDFGHAFINEAGYQHFGLVLQEINHKALVVPMTSNRDLIRQARNVGPRGPFKKKHLFYLGRLDGMHKPSVLFLNDVKFINSARVISVKAHLPVDSEMYREILRCLVEMLG